MKKLADILKSRQVGHHVVVPEETKTALDRQIKELNTMMIMDVFKEYVITQIKTGAVLREIRLPIGELDVENDFTAYTKNLDISHIDVDSKFFYDVRDFFNENGLTIRIEDNNLFLDYI